MDLTYPEALEQISGTNRSDSFHKDILYLYKLEGNDDKTLSSARTAAGQNGQLLGHFRLSCHVEICLSPEVICGASKGCEEQNYGTGRPHEQFRCTLRCLH